MISLDFTVAAGSASDWLRPLFTGVMLGLGAAVPPGPVNLEIARRTTRGGFLRGASVGFGAVTVDVFFALLVWLGVLRLIEATLFVRIPISVIGVCLLIYHGTSALANFRRHIRSSRSALISLESIAGEPTVPGPMAGYLAGLLICATSPYQAAWWLTGVPAVIQGTGSIAENRLSGLLLCVGVFMATLLWVFFFAGLLATVRSLDRSRWLAAAMDLAGGILLLSFAGLLAWKLVELVL